MGMTVKIAALLHCRFRQPARCCPRKRHGWGTRQSRWLRIRRRLCCLWHQEEPLFRYAMPAAQNDACFFRCCGAMDGSCSAGHSAGTALALAAVIAQCSPLVSAYDKRVIARLFRGNTNFVFTPNTKIPVVADSIVCKSSNVDITMRDCELIFSKGNKTWNRSLTGPQANEIIGRRSPRAPPPRVPLARSSKISRS